MDVINTFKFMRTEAGKIIGSRKKEKSEESMKLAAQHQKEIKEGILKWRRASGSPTSNPSGSGVSFTDTTGGSSISPTESGSAGSATQKNAITLTQVEAETSKEVMIFIINLEKKCPPKEEYEVFFEKLKGIMAARSKNSPKSKKSFFSTIKYAAGKLSDDMTFMRSRIGTKSAKVKQSMETYQKEVKTIKELETIHSRIWEQVTTKFVETAIQSETSTTSSSSPGKIKST
ncbi:unnamed protein product [Arabidopsis thaliana]|uniref:DUF1216 domain-containing protein n=1 Tax=Arabidopsis thaliana TaxID=3702 RepID=A0A5S9YCC0_ARATH|nr:unnamed protein product [Arabidopsis thaliana]